MKQPLTLTLLFLLTTITLVFSQTLADTNKATVIFYRSNQWGSLYHYKIKQGDSTLTKIKFTAFYMLKLEEGTYNYWAINFGGRDDITLNLKAGHTYLIKCETQFSPLLWRKPKMTLLTDDEAKKQSKKSYLKQKLAKHNLKL